ncbi:septal ring lytic transglycosylase RlpA family protein [Chitinibacter bivalviorum]|uniref:Endolytic peptidoglycan transglycosylase RlpA n=1 Tax=Chitinibacter bivalviorum TaxID=2739434 RepID=A0A7H9BKD7_9NEIS|nr:septal ring lytic transglycosylase RlpA family protein [Chitinibacter bivalviorum]QLG88786.1 septal ring lytic transglycosylase RlpA family protein [Chitinibacter bivalviorum]
MKFNNKGILISALLISACSTTPPPRTESKPAATPKPTPQSTLASSPSPYRCTYAPASGSGAFYKDDGPMGEMPANLDYVMEPTPKWEPLHKWANRPYNVLGLSFTPLDTPGQLNEQGVASWYGRKFHGQKTSTGEIYDMFQMTAAHPTLPLPSYARVTNLKNGRSVIVRVNDRGPFHKGRVMDLSFLAACRLGYATGGSAEVKVESLLPSDAPSTIVAAAAQPIVITPAPTNAPNVTPKPIAIPIADQAGGGVYVQLGAFSSQQNADNFKAHAARELDQEGSKLSIQAINKLYRVRLGPYASRDEALNAISRVTGEKNLQAVISK